MAKSPISVGMQISILIICTLISCLVIFINVLYEQPLFYQGINFIYDYQNAQPYGIIQIIQNTFSLLCQPAVLALVALLYYMLVNRKLLLIVHLSYFLFCIYIIALLKQAFQQSRPIWYDRHIQLWGWFCPKDFGNPSGHSFAVMLLYEPILSDVLGYGRKYWAGFFLFIIGTMIPLSRMYLGVHSANQIFFGLTLGLVALILFKYIYQQALYQLYWQMLMKTVKRRYLKIFGIVVLNIFCVGIPILFYYQNLANRPMLKKDIDNLNLRCGSDVTGEEVQEHILVACSIGCILFGMLYGFVLLSDTVGFRKYMLGLWKYENCLQVFIKICIFLLCLFPSMTLALIAKFFLHGVVKYLVTCLAVTLAGVALSYWAPTLAEQCGVIRLLPGYAEQYQDELDDI